MLKMESNGKLLPMVIQVRYPEHLTPNTVLCSSYRLPKDREPWLLLSFHPHPNLTHENYLHIWSLLSSFQIGHYLSGHTWESQWPLLVFILKLLNLFWSFNAVNIPSFLNIFSPLILIFFTPVCTVIDTYCQFLTLTFFFSFYHQSSDTHPVFPKPLLGPPYRLLASISPAFALT